MGCPTSVANTSLAPQFLSFELLAQGIDLSNDSLAPDPTIVKDGYSAGVVATVFQPSQAVDQDR